jgi:uncharacterized membrane protein
MTEMDENSPLSQSLARSLQRRVAIAFAACAAFLAAVVLLVDRPEWWRGLLAAGVVSAIATVASIVPLLWGLRGGMSRAPAGAMLATITRAAISIGGCALAVGVGGYPPAATFLLMLAFYVVLLATETSVLANAMWQVKLDSVERKAS